MSREGMARAHRFVPLLAILAFTLSSNAALLAQDRPAEQTPAAQTEGTPQTSEPSDEEAFDEEPEADTEGAEGDLERRSPRWGLRQRLGNKASLEFPTEERGEPRVEIQRAQTGVAWHLRLILGPLSVEANTPYMVRFRARSDGPRTANVGVSMARPPFRGLSQAIAIDLTPLWKRYQTMVVTEVDEELAVLQFNLGGSRYSVEFSDVELIRVKDREVILSAPQGPPREPKGAAAESASE